MKITDFLKPQGVITSLKSRDKTAALREMAEQLVASEPSLNAQKVFQVLLEREKISTTAIGEGVAIPHGKLSGAPRVVALFARSPEGIDFTSLDGSPTYLFFVLIAPEDAAADHLKALARISRLLKDPVFRQQLMARKTRQEIFDLIVAEDQKF
ncbi:MAG TPA: PTS sugar transporter subunit IIA [Candidatus Eisenbacteria bacterium]|nr:PTS sugar transporter subunit IIA [Candidatus Eisenbacteria bacterium]